YYFEVTRLIDLEGRIFPFFERFPLRGPKRDDLRIFREVARLVRRREHLTPTGVRAVLELRAGMNRGGKRRRPDREILALLSEWESSEAIRRAPRRSTREKIWSTPHGDMGNR